jgi:hypothetical protein
MASRQFYVYLIHEVPIEFPYYCKVGFTHSPLKRLAQLQAGNARPLRSVNYERKPTGNFGIPFSSRDHACAFEARLFDRFRQEGMHVFRDFDYEKQTQTSRNREWVAGLHPDQLWTLMLSEWHDYLALHESDPSFEEK